MIPQCKLKKDFIELVLSSEQIVPKNEVKVVEFDTKNITIKTHKLKKEGNSIVITGEVNKILIHSQAQVNDKSCTHYIYIYKNDIRVASMFTGDMIVDIFKILECKKGDIFNIRMYASADIPIVKSKDWTFFDMQVLD